MTSISRRSIAIKAPLESPIRRYPLSKGPKLTAVTFASLILSSFSLSYLLVYILNIRTKGFTILGSLTEEHYPMTKNFLNIESLFIFSYSSIFLSDHFILGKRTLSIY